MTARYGWIAAERMAAAAVSREIRRASVRVPALSEAEVQQPENQPVGAQGVVSEAGHEHRAEREEAPAQELMRAAARDRARQGGAHVSLQREARREPGPMNCTYLGRRLENGLSRSDRSGFESVNPMFVPTGWRRLEMCPMGKVHRIVAEEQPPQPVLLPVAGHQPQEITRVERRSAADLQVPGEADRGCRIPGPARARHRVAPVSPRRRRRSAHSRAAILSDPHRR